MYKRVLAKPDGRALMLYAREPLTDVAVPAAPPGASELRSHLRWHPLRGEWVAYATHRQHRTFLPPAEHNPLAPATDAERPSEVPAGNWDIAVFENLFPTLTAQAPPPPEAIVPTAPARGACEVVVFAQDASQSLGALPLTHVRLLIDVWAERAAELGAREDVRYVLPFENRGTEVGVTLHHPHGQIYAYPFVTPVAATEVAQQRAHLAREGRGLLERLVEDELADGRRVLYAGDAAAAVVPVCARYPYEVWVLPRRRVPTLAALDDGERDELARALKQVLQSYDRLWQRAFPYVLVVHGAPADGEHPEWHVHVEIYPPYRMAGRLKYLAGSELGAGVFTADALPEDTAAALRAAAVTGAAV
jgi:UDPglucose--hexose-1-phosphate uridylyltransferase